ncbi:unnamed protein product [Amoebophrya sp. A25]|nr:unnamed protein product [Amoebophrya sp. A25]|eukprot:GSA25T00004160001.1
MNSAGAREAVRFFLLLGFGFGLFTSRWWKWSWMFCSW